MRIGIDIRALMEGRITGVETYISNLLSHLFKIDTKNQYLLFANSWTNVENKIKKFQAPNIEYKIFHYPNKLFMPAQKFLGWPKIDRLLGGVDLFFFPHWRLLALDPKTPLVITFHDLSFEIVPEFFTYYQRLWHGFMNYQGAARRATKIIAVSENTKNDLVEIYKVPENKIEVIYPGVPPPLHLPLSAFGGQGEKERGYFLYFGTFEPRKNTQSVLAAYSLYLEKSQIKRPLLLAGSMGWKTKLEIPAFLKPFVTILENVNEETKTELYLNAYAFIFLSFYEGFGFPVLEAASAGLPVISSFSTSLLEIGHDFALMVNPFRSSQIADAMLELERDEALYESMKNRSLEAVKKFSWEDSARKTLELFNSIMASS